jgi:hypothetical protein
MQGEITCCRTSCFRESKPNCLTDALRSEKRYSGEFIQREMLHGALRSLGADDLLRTICVHPVNWPSMTNDVYGIVYLGSRHGV